MKKLVLLGAILVSAFIVSSANAAWIPGTPVFATENDANTLLERVVDSAYCVGIPRFGHQGEFPYEKFKVFDCSLKRNDLYCTDWRLRTVKGTKPGTFRVKNIRLGKCY